MGGKRVMVAERPVLRGNATLVGYLPRLNVSGVSGDLCMIDFGPTTYTMPGICRACHIRVGKL